VLLIWASPSAYSDEPAVSAILSLLWLAIPVTGYLVAIVATVRRPTRHFGQGMLLGLTLLMPVAFAAWFGILVSNSG
jgi:hypothetical protein